MSVGFTLLRGPLEVRFGARLRRKAARQWQCLRAEKPSDTPARHVIRCRHGFAADVSIRFPSTPFPDVIREDTEDHHGDDNGSEHQKRSR